MISPSDADDLGRPCTVACRGERTWRRHRASKAWGHPKSEITKIQML